MVHYIPHDERKSRIHSHSLFPLSFSALSISFLSHSLSLQIDEPTHAVTSRAVKEWGDMNGSIVCVEASAKVRECVGDAVVVYGVFFVDI